MKFPKVTTGLVAALALMLSACGGDDSKSSSTTVKPTNPPVTTVAEPTTTPAPPTTVKATTTTVAASEFSYVLDTSTLVCGENGCLADVPDDFPIDAENPNNPGLTLGDFASLDPGTNVCVRTEIGDFAGVAGGVAIFSPTPDFTEVYPAIHLTNPAGKPSWESAVVNGVSPEADGLTWSENVYVTLGRC